MLEIYCQAKKYVLCQIKNRYSSTNKDAPFELTPTYLDSILNLKVRKKGVLISMQQKELLEEFSMSYEELTQYLLKKYGPSKYDYFSTKDCTSKNKRTSRTSEGLYCHHIREDIGDDLSQSEIAKACPFSWQKAENLIYCNALEHLILHIKITILRMNVKRFSSLLALSKPFMPGVYMVASTINDLKISAGGNQPWRQKCYNEIRDNYVEYLQILCAAIEFMNNTYVESGKPTPDKNSLKLQQMMLGIKENIRTYKDAQNKMLKDLARSWDNHVYEKIYEDLNTCLEFCLKSPKNNIFQYQKLLVDFHGYGHPEYKDIPLDNGKFGSRNADQYISQAQFYSNKSWLNPDLIPHFVKTSSLPKSGEYLVRFMTSFEIKPNSTAFIINKDSFSFNRRRDKIAEYTDKNRVLSTTKNILPAGSTKDLTILTMDKYDLALFKESYDIFYFKVLDICQFEPKDHLE